MSLINFRKAQLKDGKLLSVLYKSVYIETYGTEGITHEFTNFIEHQFSIEKIENDIIDHTCDLWTARYNKNPVGVVQVEYEKPCPVEKFAAPEINKLYILRNFYGMGIGQNLMQLAEHEIQKRGHDRVWLWVLKTNKRAVDFYYKQGYQNIGTANFKMEHNTYMNIVMQKKL